jgi:putative Mg2+ transporter-C (MgtC) family protein
MTMSPEQAALNLAAALCLSAVIGFERQWRNRLAGLRTNTLVALGAATFVVFEQLFPNESSPTRVAAQVVSGIGFLGAGLIFREGLSVRGLNTAATLWCSAAIGVLAGAGYPLYAAIATGFVVFVNLLLRPIVSFINRQPLTATELEIAYLLSVTCRSPDEAHTRALLLQGLAGNALALRRLDSTDLEGRGDGLCDSVTKARHRGGEDRRPTEPRADGFGSALAGGCEDRDRDPCRAGSSQPGAGSPGWHRKVIG